MASKALSSRRGSIKTIGKPALPVPRAPRGKGIPAQDADPYGLTVCADVTVDPYNYRQALRPRGRATRCNSFEEEQGESYFEGPNKENICPHEPKQPRPGSMHHRRGFYQPKPLAPSSRCRKPLEACGTQVAPYISNA